jgi:nucleotide-binding universal stress UspA family protein
VDSAEVFDKLVSDLKALLARELRAEVPEAIRQSLVARQGKPAGVLNEIAREYGAGLIVVGGRRHGALARGFGGSTAHNLVRTADAPVLVVESSSRAPARVLAAVDFSEASCPTLGAAARFADLFDAQLGVVHAVEFGAPSTSIPFTLDLNLLETQSRAELEQLVEAENAPVAPDDRLIRSGRADEEIAEAAVAWHADLVVLGSHGRGWIDRLLIGSTTERLLHRLPASLLVVPISKPAALRPVPEKQRARREPRRKGMVII